MAEKTFGRGTQKINKSLTAIDLEGNFFRKEGLAEALKINKSLTIIFDNRGRRSSNDSHRFRRNFFRKRRFGRGTQNKQIIELDDINEEFTDFEHEHPNFHDTTDSYADVFELAGELHDKQREKLSQNPVDNESLLDID